MAVPGAAIRSSFRYSVTAPRCPARVGGSS